eukprot:scaffold12133_cov21-Phaeocystis_antarctica.AAC.1
MRSRTSGTNRYQMLALVQPPPVRTYLPLAIDVENDGHATGAAAPGSQHPTRELGAKQATGRVEH